MIDSRLATDLIIGFFGLIFSPVMLFLVLRANGAFKDLSTTGSSGTTQSRRHPARAVKIIASASHFMKHEMPRVAGRARQFCRARLGGVS